MLVGLHAVPRYGLVFNVKRIVSIEFGMQLLIVLGIQLLIVLHLH